MDLNIEVRSHCKRSYWLIRTLKADLAFSVVAGARESAYCLADRIDITLFGQRRPIDGMCAGIHCMYQMCKTGHAPSLFKMTSILC